MPCLRKMHGSQRIGVKGAKERFGPSCSIAYLSPSKMQTGLKKVVPLGIP